jgi:hypothetical protein
MCNTVERLKGVGRKKIRRDVSVANNNDIVFSENNTIYITIKRKEGEGESRGWEREHT